MSGGEIQDPSDVREQAETKLKQIEEQIKDLQSMRKTLKKLITECNAGNESGGSR